MKTLKWVALLAFFGLGIARAELASDPSPAKGKFTDVMGHGLKVAVDENDRVRTNITVNGGASGEHAPLEFPQRLKWDDFNRYFSTRGFFTMNYYTQMGLVRCTFPAKIDLDFSVDGENVDANITIPKGFYLDNYGRCQQVGSNTVPFGFTKDKP